MMLRLPTDTPIVDQTTDESQLELLIDLGQMLAREVELDELLATVGRRVATSMDSDRATVWLVDAETGELRSQVANLPELSELVLPPGSGVAGHVALTGDTANVCDAESDTHWSANVDTRTGYKTRSLLAVPIVDREGRTRGVLQVLNKHEGSFTKHDEAYLTTLGDQIARALEYTTLRPGNAERGVQVRGPFNHIVGSGPAMSSVYERILRAASTTATVLLRGETGTGKGLFARAIHVNSDRRDGPLIAIDCTNLPAGLVESELFGHEKGAYTGADRQVVGKVEMANGGTLFLDELGELPLALQSKLLRFLQEREYERVGGRETLRADVRIVAATNRDLAEQVRQGTFRADLYYRVKVIDIALPPLRDRGSSDTLALADHFVTLYCKRHNRACKLTDNARDALTAHSWPGNVRELEHAVERAVVLAPGEDIHARDLGLDSSEAVPQSGDGVPLPLGLTLADAQRRYVESVLDHHDGNRTKAAQALAIGRNRLARILKADE